MTKIDIELPEKIAKAAREAGLLTPQAIERLLIDALDRRHAAGALLGVADRVRKAGVEPASLEEINEEIKAARKDRAGGH